MRHALLSLAFVLVSPFAFAQTDVVDGETENPVTPAADADAATTDGPGNGETENPVTEKIEGAISTTSGAVTAFAPDEMIVLATAEGGAVNFVLSSTARYQDMMGNDIDASSIKEGTKVQVTTEENGDQLVATRIVIDN